MITAFSDVALPEEHTECFCSEVARLATHFLGDSLEITTEVRGKLRNVWDPTAQKVVKPPTAFAFPDDHELGKLQSIVRDTPDAAEVYAEY